LEAAASDLFQNDEQQLILRAAASQRKCWKLQPKGLIGSGSSLLFKKTTGESFAGDSTVPRVKKGLAPESAQSAGKGTTALWY
jgi:hypothetical protein